MAEVITRSVSLPFQGGTPYNTTARQMAVRLSPTRMVWVGCQANPNWRYFSIIDTPEGWVNGGTPTVTTQLFDQRIHFGNAAQMVRLNDNTFFIIDSASTVGGNTAYVLEIFEIDQDSKVVKVYANHDGTTFTAAGFTGAYLSGSISGNGGGSKYGNPQTFIPLADNSLIHCYVNNNSQIIYRTVSYNTTTKQITLGTEQSNANFSVSGYGAAPDLSWRKIPGSTKIALTYRSSNSSSGNWTNGSSTGQQNFAAIFNADGSVATVWPVLTTALSASDGNRYPSDSVVMSENRWARVSWSSITYHKADGSSDGLAFYNNSTSNNPLLTYALTADYILVLDRLHFVSSSSGKLKLKVLRRDDSQITSQSAASLPGTTGMEIDCQWIDTWRHEPRPVMLDNGDLFWWGLDVTGTKLVWNILKNQAVA